MEEGKTTITNFRDLAVWKEGHVLVLSVYRSTQTFPKEEMYGLVSQMRRSAVSITSNIAEGFSRQTFRDKVQFYSIAKGSLTELINQLIISKDVGFLSNEEFVRLENQSFVVQRILNGLITKSKTFFHQ